MSRRLNNSTLLNGTTGKLHFAPVTLFPEKDVDGAPPAEVDLRIIGNLVHD